MKLGTAGSLLWVATLLLLAAGCAGTQGERTTGEPAPAATPAVTAPKAPQPAPSPPAPQPPRLAPSEERRLVNALYSSIDDYFRLLREKSVERAAAHAVPEKRQALKDHLWDLVTRYRVESAHVQTHELIAEGERIVAKVRVRQTLFERNSVVPEKSMLWMTWQYDRERWLLRDSRDL